MTLSGFASLLDGCASGAPFLSNHSPQRFIAAAGTQEAKDHWLPGLLSGDLIGAVAVTEEQGGSDMKNLRTRITRSSSGLSLNGRKDWVTHAMTADLAVVLAVGADDTPCRVLVDLNALGVERTPASTRGLKHLTFGSLTFKNVPVQAWQILADEGVAGAKAGFAVARSLVAVQSVSLGFEAVRETVRYLQGRTARGSRVIDLDYTKHRIGELTSRLYAAQLMAYQSVLAIESGHPSAPALASGAKAHATDTTVGVCTELVAMCAAKGLNPAHPVAARRDDAEMLATADGTSVVNTILWGSHVKKQLLAGALRT
ncbi:acyl-CoA dehydrogenase [Arthrobacter sp. AG258]|uniref:acyl-CoA dehydrogenase family protein n=1 Tax=Arthrobacter sp. AG258 TaxID=2183899 RepID=UPI001FB94C8D|nr:acyl-CoA dehydrogenase [Arthrobacter sp. AG258]